MLEETHTHNWAYLRTSPGLGLEEPHRAPHWGPILSVTRIAGLGRRAACDPCNNTSRKRVGLIVLQRRSPSHALHCMGGPLGKQAHLRCDLDLWP